MSNWNEKEVVNILVRHFGKEFREEIENSLQCNYKEGTFEVGGDDYIILHDYDYAEQKAIKQVEDMLYDEPELFNQDFLTGYIYMTSTDRRVTAVDEAYFFFEGLDDEDIELYMDEYNLDKQDFLDEDGDLDIDKVKEELESIKADEVYDMLEDPINYFVDYLGSYTVKDLLKQAFIQIDCREAAEAAVRDDGWAHFLSRYDGNYEEIDEGFIVFRN